MQAFGKYVVLFFIALSPLSVNAEVLGVAETETGTGRMIGTDQGGLVLHLKGSYYDMGVQHAKLLGDDAKMAVRSARHMIRLKYPFVPSSLVIDKIHEEVFKKQEPYMPSEFKDEMRGLADGSGVDLKIIQALHAMTYLTSCSGAAAWGEATKDGELYFTRSNDIEVVIDPLTNRPYHDKAMIIIYEPLDGIPYMIFAWPGMIGASDGMNAKGIAIGNMSLPSRFETPAGVPMMFRIKQALAKSSTLEEAIRWMTVKPLAGGYNFIVADAKIPDARVIEMDAEKIYIGGWDGPSESNSYSYQGKNYQYNPIKDLITRTNHPLSDDLIAHRERPIDDGKPHSKITYQRYLDLRARQEAAHGTLDLETMNQIMRDHYKSIKWERGPSLGITSHQIALAPKSGDFTVSFSKGNPVFKGRVRASAFSLEPSSHNFFELIGQEPERKTE